MPRMLAICLCILSYLFSPASATESPKAAPEWSVTFVVSREANLPHRVKRIAFFEGVYFNDGDPSKWLALQGPQAGQRVRPIRESNGQRVKLQTINGDTIDLGINGVTDLYSSPYSSNTTLEIKDRGSMLIRLQVDSDCLLQLQPMRNLHGEVTAQVDGVEGDVYYADLHSHLVSAKGCSQYSIQDTQ